MRIGATFMIRCKCNNCGYEIKTYDKFAGKRVRCPKCKEPLQLPPVEGGTSPKVAAIIKFSVPVTVTVSR